MERISSWLGAPLISPWSNGATRRKVTDGHWPSHPHVERDTDGRVVSTSRLESRLPSHLLSLDGQWTSFSLFFSLVPLRRVSRETLLTSLGQPTTCWRCSPALPLFFFSFFLCNTLRCSRNRSFFRFNPTCHFLTKSTRWLTWTMIGPENWHIQSLDYGSWRRQRAVVARRSGWSARAMASQRSQDWDSIVGVVWVDDQGDRLRRWRLSAGRIKARRSGWLRLDGWGDRRPAWRLSARRIETRRWGWLRLDDWGNRLRGSRLDGRDLTFDTRRVQ